MRWNIRNCESVVWPIRTEKKDKRDVPWMSRVLKKKNIGVTLAEMNWMFRKEGKSEE